MQSLSNFDWVGKMPGAGPDVSPLNLPVCVHAIHKKQLRIVDLANISNVGLQAVWIQLSF